MCAALEMNNSLILLIISNMPWWQKVSFVPQAGTRIGQTKGGAARSAHGPRSDPSASVATTAFDEAFCNINLGIISVNRALMLAGSQPEN